MKAIFFFLMIVGLSSGVYGQKPGEVKVGKVTHRIFNWPHRGIPSSDPVVPLRDTVIMRGEEIEVGSYLGEDVIKEIEIIGFGKSKKSDLEKGYYAIKLKPKQTTTYEFKWTEEGSPRRSGRIVYVAKTKEEKKQLQKKLKTNLGPRQRTTYRYRNTSGIKMTASSASVKK